jgi:hypothetical protein
MELPNSLRKLCSPALLYFVISMIGFIMILIQNLGNTKKYTIGSFTVNVTSTFFVFIFKFLYIIFWTWILNLLCKSGFSVLSWLFVLFPFILFFVLLGLFLIKK